MSGECLDKPGRLRRSEEGGTSREGLVKPGRLSRVWKVGTNREGWGEPEMIQLHI